MPVASQYTSVRFTEHLALEGIRPSIGSVGDAYDTQRLDGKRDRLVQDRIHPHHHLQRQALPHHQRRRVRHRRLGRLVEQPATPRHLWDGDPDRSRTAVLRDPQPRVATHMRAAEDLGRFTISSGSPTTSTTTNSDPTTSVSYTH